MMASRFLKPLSLLGAVAIIVGACSSSGSSPAPASAGASAAPSAAVACEAGAGAGLTQIPDVVDGKFNIAMVLIGPHNDGGWSQAHYEGLEYLARTCPTRTSRTSRTSRRGPTPSRSSGASRARASTSSSATSFGYMDPMATVAEEFPDQTFLHLTGYKSNGKNFGNFFGAMENMKYLAGMIAGSRAKLDGNPKIGYMATFPIPEEIRLGNAIMLGVKQTCPECTMDVRWINTWHDPVNEKEAAASLFDAGAHVVFTGADTPASPVVAQEKGKWGVTYDHPGSCKVDACLTAPYWIWGPSTRIAEQVKAETSRPGYEYFDADSGAMGLFGFMDGQTPQPGSGPPGRRRAAREGHARQDAGGQVHPVRRVRRARSRTTRASRSSPPARSSAGGPRPVPARRRGQPVHRVHEVVRRGHQRRAPAVADR